MHWNEWVISFSLYQAYCVEFYQSSRWHFICRKIKLCDLSFIETFCLVLMNFSKGTSNFHYFSSSQYKMSLLDVFKTVLLNTIIAINQENRNSCSLYLYIWDNRKYRESFYQEHLSSLKWFRWINVFKGDYSVNYLT